MERHQIVDHFALSLVHSFHLHRYLADVNPELLMPFYQRHNVSAVNDILTRQTSDVRARPTDELPFHNRRPLALSSHGPTHKLPARTAPQHQNVVLLRFRHARNLLLAAGDRVAPLVNGTRLPLRNRSPPNGLR